MSCRLPHPLSAVPMQRVTQPHPPALPPIAHLDQHPSRISPVTPPQVDDASQWYTQGSQAVKLPPIQQQPLAVHKSHVEDVSSHPPICSPPSEPVDWVMCSTLRSSQFPAEKTCEMICYFWFSSLSATSSRSGVSSIPEPTSATVSLQLAVSSAIVRFMQKVLETTQVSQSVIVLALHYIYRLKIHNRYTNGQSGSEYRVAIAALMMANKFLDDNTYMNKTRSEASGIGLEETNKTEREFLLGIDSCLYVDKATYISWLNLLKGLVLAKEKDCRHWRRSPRTPLVLTSSAGLGRSLSALSSRSPPLAQYTPSPSSHLDLSPPSRLDLTPPHPLTSTLSPRPPPLAQYAPPPPSHLDLSWLVRSLPTLSSRPPPLAWYAPSPPSHYNYECDHDCDYAHAPTTTIDINTATATARER
ncbi:hypothetical protein BDY19DRAFT_998786 [Irpex rosettiformis]|uniref:Uncharacterized protein n=1 Tax=Irpex rosettiformis TaxID=378272 RepID=A0ACB8TMG0_9APHY|nr:hypothetical protein BDY19DRAFT_998786 [Irpex rosettiformis]